MEGQRKRTRRPVLSPAEKARRRREAAKKKKRGRVVLGDEFDRWRSLQRKVGLKTDTAMAKFLLDMLDSHMEKQQTTSVPGTSMMAAIPGSSGMSTSTPVQATQPRLMASEHESGTREKTPVTSSFPAVDMEEYNGRVSQQPLAMSCESFDYEANDSDSSQCPIFHEIRRQGVENTADFSRPNSHPTSCCTVYNPASKPFSVKTEKDVEVCNNTEKDGFPNRSDDCLNSRFSDCSSIGALSRAINRIITPTTGRNEKYMLSIENSKSEETEMKHETSESLVQSLLGDIIDSVVKGAKRNTSTGKERKYRKASKQSVSDGAKSKRKLQQSSVGNCGIEYSKKPKKVEIEEDKDDKNRRLSSRLQHKGFRPDYAAYDDLNDSSNLENEICESDNNSTESLLEPDDELLEPSNEETDVDDSNILSENEQVSTCKSTRASRKPKVVDKDPDFSKDKTPKNKKLKENSRDSCSENEAEDISKLDLHLRMMHHDLIKRKNRILVTLADHKDKFYEEEVVSLQMRDRGKSQEEKTSLLMVCALCRQYKTENKTGLEVHLERHLNGDFDCPQCDAKFDSVYDRNCHMHEIHTYADECNKRSGRYKCAECPQSFSVLQMLRDHMKMDHGKKGIVCRFCSQVCPTMAEFHEHSVQNHKETMRQCANCNNYFVATNVRHHRRYCTGKQEKVPCEICGKQMRADSLKAHVKHVHENIRKHNCPSCNYSAKCAQRLILHIRARHTGEHVHKCDQCDFTCVQSIQLKSHQRTHTGEKPYKCDQCTYAAAWNVQLKDHKKLHGLPFTVTCDECGILVKNERCLNLHKKKEHQDKV